MKTYAYSVYDRKALVYHMPFYAITDAVAVRTFSDAVADPNMAFGRHPNDYVLFLVAEFDDNTGIATPIQPLRHIVDAQVLVQALQSEIPFPEGTTSTRPSHVDRPNGAGK